MSVFVDTSAPLAILDRRQEATGTEGTQGTGDAVTHKIYCYVDESGQDTRGDVFVVAVVVVAEDKDDLTRILEAIEHKTSKGRIKWHKTLYERRLAYMQRILAEPELRGKCHLCFALPVTRLFSLHSSDGHRGS